MGVKVARQEGLGLRPQLVSAAAMQRHYSTINPDEQRRELAKVVDLMAVRRTLESKAGSGVESGVEAGQEKTPSGGEAPNGADSFSKSGAGEGT
jgi:hypothetical protein